MKKTNLYNNKKIALFFGIFLAIFILASFSTNGLTISKDMAIYEVLQSLGDEAVNHEIGEQDEELIRQGKELFINGITKDKKEKKTKLQSPHFKCISCHNTVIDEGDLKTMDAQARIDFCKENKLPILQGTTVYGIVNRTSFYNGDYQKKYEGNPRILKSHKDLREAVQLCAIECAQGRPLKNWELDAVLAYFWSIEFKIGDLRITDEEIEKINDWIKESENEKAIDFIKEQYAQQSPATFGNGPKDAREGFSGIEGNADNGKTIYDLSCLYCHKDKKYSLYELDKHKMTFQHLKRHIPKYDRYSIYQVSRYGAPSSAGKRAYMPQFTLEKMNDQQLEDLRAYVDKMAKE